MNCKSTLECCQFQAWVLAGPGLERDPRFCGLLCVPCVLDGAIVPGLLCKQGSVQGVPGPDHLPCTDSRGRRGTVVGKWAPLLPGNPSTHSTVVFQLDLEPGALGMDAKVVNPPAIGLIRLIKIPPITLV